MDLRHPGSSMASRQRGIQAETGVYLAGRREDWGGVPVPMSSRPSAVLALASILIMILQLTACVEPEPLPTDPTGRLFGRGLEQIADLYIVPVSSRKLALAAARRLTRLDPKFAVWETPGPQEKTEIALEGGGRDVATYPIPSSDDPHLWGGWLGHLLADANATSPALARRYHRTRLTRHCLMGSLARSTVSRGTLPPRQPAISGRPGMGSAGSA